MSERFDEHARRLREELDAEPFTPAELEAARRRVLERRPPRRRPLLLLAPALAAALILIFAWPKDQGLIIAQGADCVTRSTNSLDVAECSTSVELQIGRKAEDLSFRSGRAHFSVDKRPTKPFQIAVSHGTIVVIGTRFSVEQRTDHGRIEVEEGVVEFHWSDGSSKERLPAGSALDWPRATKTATVTAEAKPEPEPEQKPTKRHERAPKASAEDLMRRLFQLRSQRRWDEAIALLADGTRRADFTNAQKERLSFELGTVLRQAGREKEACTHLHKHLARFPKSTQRQQITRDCP